MDERAFLAMGEQLTKALVTSDWDLYRPLFRLPVHIAPRGGKAYVMTTEAELHEDFVLYAGAVAAQRVSDIYRRVVARHDLESGNTRFDVEMHILSGATRLVAPFQASFDLHDTPEGPRITAITSALGHIRWTLGDGPLSPT